MIRNAANPVSLNLDATVIAKLTLPISRVLVLEDNFLIALDAEDMLKNLGIPHVEIAVNLTQASTLMAKHTFDFALLDVDLGQETSFGFAQELAGRGVPFGFVSGYDEGADFPPALRARARLPKPFDEAMMRAFLIAAFETSPGLKASQG